MRSIPEEVVVEDKIAEPIAPDTAPDPERPKASGNATPQLPGPPPVPGPPRFLDRSGSWFASGFQYASYVKHP